MSNKVLKGVALALVLAYSGIAAAKSRAPDPELGLAIASQGNEALVAIRDESHLTLIKPERSRVVAEHAALEASTHSYSASGASAASTERCAE